MHIFIKTTFRTVGIMLIPPAIILMLFIVFDFDKMNLFYLLDSFSIAFLFGLLMGLGALTIFLSKAQWAKKRYYQILFPWIAASVYLYFSMYKYPEAMKLFPIFLAISSMGGIIAGYYRHKDQTT